MSCLFREQSKLLSLGTGDDLGTFAFGLRQQFSSHHQHLSIMNVPDEHDFSNASCALNIRFNYTHTHTIVKVTEPRLLCSTFRRHVEYSIISITERG
jgi:hypothetical protein